MNRRDFIGSILAACAAPAIVRADSLMRIIPQQTLFYGMPPPGELVLAHFAGPFYPGGFDQEGIHFAELTDYRQIQASLHRLESVFQINDNAGIVSMGFIGNHPQGLFVGGPKEIISWERIAK